MYVVWRLVVGRNGSFCGKIAIVSLAVAEKQLFPAVDLATRFRSSYSHNKRLNWDIWTNKIGQTKGIYIYMIMKLHIFHMAVILKLEYT